MQYLAGHTLPVEGLLWPGPVLSAIETSQYLNGQQRSCSSGPTPPNTHTHAPPQPIIRSGGFFFLFFFYIPIAKSQVRRTWWVRTYPSSDILAAEALWGSPRALSAWCSLSESLTCLVPRDALFCRKAAGPSSHPFTKP